MEFVRNYVDGESWADIEPDLKHFVEKCAADIKIMRTERGQRVTLTVEDRFVHNFLACVSDYVDEHALAAWTRQAEMTVGDRYHKRTAKITSMTKAGKRLKHV